MSKKELHCYIDSSLYYALRAYALKHYSDYKNWLGKAVEDAIHLLLENRTQTQTLLNGSNKIRKGKTSRSLACIEERLRFRRAIHFEELLRIIVDCAGSDVRTWMKYLNLLQGLDGLRFHAKNECIIYIEYSDDIPVKRIMFTKTRQIEALLKKCCR